MLTTNELLQHEKHIQAIVAKVGFNKYLTGTYKNGNELLETFGKYGQDLIQEKDIKYLKSIEQPIKVDHLYKTVQLK